MANRSSSFLSRVVIVLTGGALAQVINLLTMPIITRIYPPDVFGFFANVTLLAGFIVPFITLSLPMVAVLIRNERHSEEFVKANIRLSLSISFVLIVMAYFFFIAGGGPLLLYGVLMSCALGVQECLIFLFIKKRYFAIRSLFLVVQAGVVSALKILFGLLYSGNESLIYAMLVGYILINLSMYLNLNLNRATIAKLRFIARIKRNIQFVKYRTPQTLITSLNQLLPMAVVTHFFGINEAGLYALARLTIRVPSNLLGKSIADVLYPRFFELLYDKKAIIRLLNKSTIALIVIGFFPVLIAFFYADILFGNIFGSDWVSSADYARWIVLWGYINLICRPSVALIPILKMELVFVKNSIFNMLITCAALMIGVVHFSEPSEMIKLLSIAAMLPQLLVIIIAYVKVRNHEKE